MNILITGATRGLGRALAIDFAKLGHRVFATGRTPATLDALSNDAQTLGLDITAISNDIGNIQEHNTLVQQIQERAGHLDVIIHNASLLGPRVELAEYPANALQRVLDVNVSGPLLLTQALLPILKDGAALLFVSSGVGLVGKARWGAYSVSKFALEATAQIYAEELKDRGIRVFTVDPGSMRTQMRAQAYPKEDPQTLMHPKDNTRPFILLALEAGIEHSGRRFKAKSFEL